jgi:hypothetical protein
MIVPFLRQVMAFEFNNKACLTLLFAFGFFLNL